MTRASNWSAFTSPGPASGVKVSFPFLPLTPLLAFAPTTVTLWPASRMRSYGTLNSESSKSSPSTNATLAMGVLLFEDGVPFALPRSLLVDALSPLVEALDLQRRVSLQDALLLVGLGAGVGVGGDQDLAFGHVVVGELPVLALVHGGDAAGEPAHGTPGHSAAQGRGPDADTDGGTDAGNDERRRTGDGPGDAADGPALGRLLHDIANEVGVTLPGLGLGRRRFGVWTQERDVFTVDARPLQAVEHLPGCLHVRVGRNDVVG